MASRQYDPGITGTWRPPGYIRLTLGKHERTLFGERLQNLRKKAGLSQQKLADAAGISREAVARFESGEDDNPKLKTIVDLSAALGARPSELVDFVEFKTAEEMIAAFSSSPHAQVAKLEPGDLEWLKTAVSGALWVNKRPTLETMLELLKAYRSADPQDRK